MERDGTGTRRGARCAAFGRSLAGVAALGLALGAGAAAAAAADFPAKAIHLVVPFASGGAADITGRLVGQELALRAGQTVLIENRPGGSTQVGTEYVAAAEPDGYTILLGTSSIVLAAVLDPKATINAQRDFVALANIASAPFVWIVGSELPVRNLAEFIAYAKANPGKASFGTSGAGSSKHLSGELLNLRGAIKMVHVLYKSESNAVTDVAGGHLFAAPASYGALAAQLGGNRLRPIAVTGRTRMKALPNVPTMEESGMTPYQIEFWNGLFAPIKTPAPVVERLSALIVESIRAAHVTQRLEDLGFRVEASNSAAFGRQIGEDARRWGDIIRSTGVVLAR